MNCSGRDARSLNLQRPPEPIDPISEAQPTRPVGKLRAITSICRKSTFPTAHTSQPVGALLAMGPCQSTKMLNVRPQSLAGLAPTGDMRCIQIRVQKKAMSHSGHRPLFYRRKILFRQIVGNHMATHLEAQGAVRSNVNCYSAGCNLCTGPLVGILLHTQRFCCFA
jgi:hypothetical protein